MALEDATAKFTVRLKDDVSQGADSANRALAKLQRAMKGEEATIKELQKQMRLLKASGGAGSDAFRELEEKLKKTGKELEANQQKFMKLGGVMGRNYGATKQSGKGALEMSAALKKLPGPAGEAARALDAVKAGVGGMSVKTIVAVAATAALVAGVTLATAALLKYGVATADARRNEALQLEGMTKVRNYWGLAADSASFLQQTIDDVSASSAIGRDQVAAYAKQLYSMGLRAGNLQQALKGVAIVSSTQGEEQASLFASMAAGAAATGQSVKRLADDVQARLGGIAKKQMLSLDVQTKKLHENFAMLFSGLGIEKFLGALNEVFSLFSQTTATGKALRTLVDTLLQPLIDQGDKAGSVMRRLFQGMTIGALILTVGFLKLRNAIRDAFAGTVVEKWYKQLTGSISGADVAIKSGIAGASALAVVMGVLAVKTALALAPWLLLGAAIGAVGYAFYWVTTKVIENWDAIAGFFSKIWGALGAFQQFNFAELGGNIVRGIANGIANGAAWVIDAIKGLASQAVTAFKDKLGIHSPSRVFAEQGRFVAAGAAEGIEDGAPSVQKAADSMAPVPRLAASGGSPGASLTIGDIHVHLGEGTPKDAAQAVYDEITRMFESLSLQMGAPAGGTL